jgi:hypothetical protein
MKNLRIPSLATIFLFLTLNISHGQTILTNPVGAKPLAMGGTGYAIANDSTAPFFNPALLGVSNSRWDGGEANYYREPMMFDVVQSNYSIVLQHKNIPKFGFSTSLNHIDIGGISVINEDDSLVDIIHSYELLFSSGIGYCLYGNNVSSHSVGIGAKYFRSYSGGTTSGTAYNGYTFSFDFGYLLQIIDRLRVGLVVCNVGPNSIWKNKNDSIIGKYNQPATVTAGIGYIDNFDYGKLRVLTISTELSFRRTLIEFLGFDVEELVAGIELNFFNTVPIRAGFNKSIRKKGGGIDQVSIGTGVSLFNHFNFDIFWSFYNEKYGRDDPDYGFSLSMIRILNWNKNDKKWWLKNWDKVQE